MKPEEKKNILKNTAFVANHRSNEATNRMIMRTNLDTSTKAKLMVAGMLVNSVLKDLMGGR